MDFFEEFREELEEAERVEKVYMAAQLHPNQIPKDWQYPALEFGFNFWNCRSTDAIVHAAMSALDTTAKYDLVERCPEGFPQQPNYEYNYNKYGRVERYLGHTVFSPQTRTTEIRENVIKDLDATAQEVLDEIEKQNHPVAQMIAQMYVEYGRDFGDITIRSVTTEVIILTHWKMLVARLNQQTNAWRAGETND